MDKERGRKNEERETEGQGERGRESWGREEERNSQTDSDKEASVMV